MNNLNPSRKLAAPPRAHFFLALFLLAGLLAGTMNAVAGGGSSWLWNGQAWKLAPVA